MYVYSLHPKLFWLVCSTSSSWGPGKNPTHTVHVDDVAGALFACAEWMAQHSRQKADSLAGEQIIFHNEKNKVAEVEGMVPHDRKVIAPVFNLVSGDTCMILCSDIQQ
jgi:hypothetical protein